MRRLLPEPAVDVAIGDVYAELDWPSGGERPFVALNMVSSVDGVAAIEGGATGIGSRVDRALMMALRANADALLFGAGTVRADRVGHGVPTGLTARRMASGRTRQPLLAVLTASGDLPFERAMFGEPDRVVVFVSERTPAAAVARLRAQATVTIAGDAMPNAGEAVRILGREYGVRHILSEGGPRLNRTLLEARLLDELFLTVAPKLLAGDGPTIIAGPTLSPPISLSLLSLHEHEGELFLRYTVDYGDHPGDG